MKSLHRSDLFAWSHFDETRNLDFNSVFWARPGGKGVAIDPLPVSAHDRAHIAELGGVGWVLITNADHVRAARAFKDDFGAKIAVPAAERDLSDFAVLPIDAELAADEVLGCGIRCIPMHGSKTLGELAFLFPDGATLVTGDLIRAHRAGGLNLLPDAKLRDKAAALASVRALLELDRLEAILVGDGQSVFTDARRALRALL